MLREMDESVEMSDAHPHLYSIKRHGTNIRDCEAEPIRTPGCIQSHGALVALRVTDLIILQISENCGAFFGRTPEEVLGHGVQVLIGDEHQQRLRQVIDTDPVERNPLYVTTLSRGTGNVADASLDISVHTIGGIAIVEFEPTGRDTGSATTDYFSLVRKIATRLHAAADLETFCGIAAEEVRRITGLDRVMIYRFHPDASGEVFAEDKLPELPSWKGLRYPAYDIPKSARDIFKKLTIRPLADVHGVLAEMVPLGNPDTGEPLELTHCVLRGASVMYTEYLANMKVAASLTMPILRDGELWGMVACHHGTPKNVSFQVRAAAEFVSQVISLELRAVEDREHFEYARHIDTTHLALTARAASEGELAVMTEPSPHLLDGIECSGAAVFHRGQWWTVGNAPPVSQLEALGRWLQERLRHTVNEHACFATDRLSADYPDAAEIAAVASGVLAVPVSRSCANLIVWFRKEAAQTLTWGGNPHDKPTVVGPHGARLTPRASFEAWKETVHQRSDPWKAVEIEAALKLRALVLDLVVTRAEQIAALNTDLAKSNEELDAFAYVASHDLKEPLRGIRKYASHLLEDAKAGRVLDGAAQERLESLLRLTVRMDALLASLFHFSRVGRLELELEIVALDDVVRESVEMLVALVDEKGAQVTIPRPLPHVWGDRVRLREVFANLISNAIKYNVAAVPHVEIGYLEADQHVQSSSKAALSGKRATGRVFYVRDNGIGIDSRYHEQVFDLFNRLHARDAYGGGTGAGLTIARKLIDRHGGAIWLESTAGQGATFYFTLPQTNITKT